MAINEVINEVMRKIDVKKKKIFKMLLAIAGAGLVVGEASAGNGGWMDGFACEMVMAAESSTTVRDTDREVNGENGRVEGRKKIEQGEQRNKKAETVSDEEGVYDFKDNKTTGTITVTKEWSDKRTNSERPEPEIKISTKKPSKSTLGYTVTFHGNKDTGLVFDDGSDVNEVVYNSSGQIVDGAFKMPAGFSTDIVSWFTDKALTNKVNVSEDGVIQMTLNGDIDLWGKAKTFEIKGYRNYSRNDFNYLIPETVTEIIFTDVVKPENASVIDVDADGDGGAVAWTENGGTVMKVSTQIKGMKVQAAKNSAYMFSCRAKLTNINFSMLDTANVTSMSFMFEDCSSLTSLDLTPFNTVNVASMNSTFYGCSGLTSLDLTSFNTANVTDMYDMFKGCSGLTSLDLTSFNTANVTSMSSMFDRCSDLTSLDLTPFNTSKVTSMSFMFFGCSGLTSLDLTPLDTANVTDMESMFDSCSDMTSLDLTPLNTAKVTNMSGMFDGCSGMTSLDLTSLNTVNVTNMNDMFYGCSGLTNLDLAPLNTAKVTNMSGMFYGCSGLTSLDLTPLNTENVTNMDDMFNGCSGLTNLDLTPLNTAKVTSMYAMFNRCSGLTSLDLTSFDTTNVTNMIDMFCNCSSLTNLNLTSFNTAKVTGMGSMFGGRSGLTTIKTGATFKFAGAYYSLTGTWQNAAGEIFNGNYGTANFPSNVADTYTKIKNY